MYIANAPKIGAFVICYREVRHIKHLEIERCLGVIQRPDEKSIDFYRLNKGKIYLHVIRHLLSSGSRKINICAKGYRKSCSCLC